LAVDAVATELSRLRIRAGQVECKVFGGANAMFQESMGLGRKNVEIAFQELEKRGFKVVGSSVGGTTGRKLVFLTHTGEVFMRFVRKREPA
jgi:chemotaxis protein CheD